MERRAFTIVELMVAVSLAALLTLMALPRFSDLIHRNDFIDSANKLVDCLQRAQRAAGSPQPGVTASGKPVRYVAAQLSNGASNGTTFVSCSYALYPSTDSQGNQVSLDTIVLSGNASPVYSVQAPNLQFSGSTGYVGVSVYFGTLEQGMPVAFRSCTNTGCATPIDNNIRGFPLDLTVASSDFSGTLSMAFSGIPIQFFPN